VCNLESDLSVKNELGVRLDKFAAENSEYSRTDIKRLAKQGFVSVNGTAVRSCSQKIQSDDVVKIDNRVIEAVGMLYIAMHKPAGYVCATSDSDYPTVLDLVSDKSLFDGADNHYQRIAAAKLQIVGRLDKDTTGLLLLTNDGEWNHAITSPKSDCSKSYLATLAEPIDSETEKRFKSGIELKGESKLTKPAQLERLNEFLARVTISEGRYHQVKRMFAACNNKVTKLHRERIGNLQLEETLLPGHFRLLSTDETV
jgi:16S rRNA pseudouridine516 synthase